MQRGNRLLGPARLQQRLLRRFSRLQGQRGLSLPEWMVAQALGLLISAAAVWLFLHQSQQVSEILLRQVRADEQQALLELLRRELRIAGHRHRTGPNPDYDELRLEGSRESPTLSYLCDECGASDRWRAAGFRLQSAVLSQRLPGTNAYQALHDAPISGLRSWQVSVSRDQGDRRSDCLARVTITLHPQTSTAPLSASVRPRNLGPLPCETSASEVHGTPSVATRPTGSGR